MVYIGNNQNGLKFGIETIPNYPGVLDWKVRAWREDKPKAARSAAQKDCGCGSVGDGRVRGT